MGCICYIARSIPACAGQPCRPLQARLSWKVDPRVRGAAPRMTTTASLCSGRSPRARGSRSTRSLLAKSRGSIPACAGQPRSAPVPIFAPWVDPRVRGAAQENRLIGRCRRGRSPRARGSRANDIFCDHAKRSIPACAGQPYGWTLPTPRIGVDPRVRGAADRPRHAGAAYRGRSPRARGSRKG